jgi:L-iditol 2-dehydrogenase
MQVARLTNPYHFEMCERPIPEPGPDEVLLKNIYLGVCTSDLQIYHGQHAFAAMPVTPGHEVAGIVAEVGCRVADWHVGDRVVLQPQLFCNDCYPCRMGHFNVCENLRVIGVHTDGCACEYTVVPAWNLHALPDNIRFREAALIEPMAVGFGVVRRVREVTDIRDKRVCIVGAGTIGNLTAQAFQAMGAKDVLITDILDDKLALARRCGINHAANTKDTSLVHAILECFGADKADIIVDSAANPAVFQSIMGAARKASIVVMSGNYKQQVTLDVTQIQRQEITLLGHMMYLRREFDDALEQLSLGRIVTKGLITQEWTLRQYPEAFRFIDEHPGEVVKMVVRITEDETGL